MTWLQHNPVGQLSKPNVLVFGTDRLEFFILSVYVYVYIMKLIPTETDHLFVLQPLQPCRSFQLR